MVRTTFITHRGDVYHVEADPGTTLMKAAVNNSVPGIEADCGGACACATCHVFVEPDWFDVTGAANDSELGMLELSGQCTPLSRLACQIELSESLDGLMVRIPEAQF